VTFEVFSLLWRNNFSQFVGDHFFVETFIFLSFLVGTSFPNWSNFSYGGQAEEERFGMCDKFQQLHKRQLFPF